MAKESDEHCSSVMKAAEREDVEALSQIDDTELARLQDEDRRSVLYRAVAAGSDASVRFIAAKVPALVSQADEGGHTPLITASAAGQEKCVAALLNESADPNAESSSKRTALHYAASKQHGNIAQMLIAHGAKVNKRDAIGATPLHRAASTNSDEALQVLLLQNCSIDPEDATGATPLEVAVEAKADACARRLAAAGAALERAHNTSSSAYSALSLAQQKMPALVPALKAARELGDPQPDPDEMMDT